MAKPATPAQERPSLTLRRHYPVAAEKVWRAWTDPQALKAWFGPEEIVAVPLAEVDLRVGGRFRVTMLAADGETHDVSGVYQELVPNRKLVFSWAWRSTPERESRVTVRIEPDGNGCELVLMHEQFFDEVARDGHEHGWTGAMVKLEQWLAKAAE
ncbi:SRPBCC domain-containing protein [Variovorax sp. DXTD-1]|uniref:SRPBCC family protein n=1 Tax=Variovorax sp. DXTD-1 TaxID=2495592 RepID=UPI000F87118A|nr:SRPBCC domain-containing protein [Variovorax sp. DXTD-1]RST47779.1 SRPBCC domain-containing protein [Variovorax sp. DXTD-1]